MKRAITEYFGEVVHVSVSDTGDYHCPICGLLWEDTSDWDPDGFLQCLEVCPCCETQLGNDDVDEVPAKSSNPAEKRWKILRLQWLNKIGWPESALKQLRINLGIDTDALKREAGRAG